MMWLRVLLLWVGEAVCKVTGWRRQEGYTHCEDTGSHASLVSSYLRRTNFEKVDGKVRRMGCSKAPGII